MQEFPSLYNSDNSSPEGIAFISDINCYSGIVFVLFLQLIKFSRVHVVIKFFKKKFVLKNVFSTKKSSE